MAEVLIIDDDIDTADALAGAMRQNDLRLAQVRIPQVAILDYPDGEGEHHGHPRHDHEPKLANVSFWLTRSAGSGTNFARPPAGWCFEGVSALQLGTAAHTRAGTWI
jgi:hypothetical protein